MLLGGVGRVHAEAVAAGGEVVELGGDVGVHEGAVVDEGVFAVAAIVFGLDEEGRGGEFVGGVGGVELGVVGWGGEVGGVDEDGEVGAGGDFGVGVGGGGSGFYVVVVGVGAEEDGEVGTGGEAHDADVRGVDVPVGGVGAGDAHGLLGVFKVGGVGGIVAGFAAGLGDAVFDEDAGDAEGVEPVAGVETFAVPGEHLVAAAGEDEDGGAGVGAVVARGEDGERGNGVGEAGGAVAADEAVGGLGEVGLGRGGLGLLGWVVRPERLRGLLGLRMRGGGEHGGEERRGEEREGRQAEGAREVSHAVHTMPIDA